MSQQNEEKPLNSESLICDLIEDETLKTEMLNDIICIVSALNYSHFKIDSKEQVYWQQIIKSVKNWAEYYSQKIVT